jgi:large subunit ribosomal protein L21
VCFNPNPNGGKNCDNADTSCGTGEKPPQLTCASSNDALARKQAPPSFSGGGASSFIDIDFYKIPSKIVKHMPKKNAKNQKEAFAVIETGGKQYVVSEGDTITIEKFSKPAKEKSVTFDKVLLTHDGGRTLLGSPYISGKKVLAELVEEGRGKKIRIVKYKSKVRYLVQRGHRQPFAKVKITKLS